jgi:hypothetical protein
MTDVILNADQIARLNAIIIEQQQREAKDQDWTEGYKLVADAIQNADVKSGVKFFLKMQGMQTPTIPTHLPIFSLGRRIRPALLHRESHFPTTRSRQFLEILGLEFWMI